MAYSDAKYDGTIYHTQNNGDFIFLNEEPPKSYINSNGHNQIERMARVKFVLTGTEAIVQIRHALAGSIRDPYYPTIYGVASIGNVNVSGEYKNIYLKWKNMISHRYNPEDKQYEYYKDFIIDPRWLCFENFLSTIHTIQGYQDVLNNPNGLFSLDINRSIPNNKTFSPETCVWVPTMLNRIVRNKERYKREGQYYGIERRSDSKFKVTGKVRTPYGPVGTFSNEIAAVNAREYYRSIYHKNVIANEDYPKMPLDEVVKYRLRKSKPKLMYKLSKDDNQ